jgi:hypothetical protein
MPHGRVRPAPPPLLVQEGRLPSDLMEQARARQAEAEVEVLVLPREAQAHLQDGDPSVAIYDYGDGIAVDVLRRAGVRADFLTGNRRVVAQFTEVIWVDFAVLVSAGLTVEAVVAIARYLVGLVRRVRQSGIEPRLELTHGRPDGTFLRANGTDPEAVLKAFYASLAADIADPDTGAALLRLAAGTDPSTALEASEAPALDTDTESDAADRHDTPEGQ